MYNLKLKNFDIKKISESGQIFRLCLNKNKTGYDLICKNKHLFIEHNNNSYLFSCSKKEWENEWSHYFDFSNKTNPYNIIEKNWSKNDKFLLSCVNFASGIRILNQDPWEMLISFIISQRKSIKSIQLCIKKLCELCGKKNNNKFLTYYSFPSPIQILKYKNKLSKCGVGYRKDYLIDASEKVLSGEIKLYDRATINMSDLELLLYLMKIKGVGIKVASCVALFAYHRLSVCPEDIWIKRVKEKYYDGNFPDKYKKYLGVVQQYWFMGIRGLKLQ